MGDYIHAERNRIADEFSLQVLAVDLLNPSAASEAKKHKLKTLVPQPRSFFMDVKCPGCFTITTVFSHAQTVVICQGCTTVLCQPTGGARTWNRCFEDRFIPGVQWVVEDSTVLLRNSKVSTNIVVLSHGDSRDVLPKCPSAAQLTPDELNEQPTFNI
ncbi:hypothetical protein MKX07_003377 [Trichoderma sp. CBMAI-0711]|nr:hypothetical protein MKX07_003377 [Trichoderma sp. CBMAI-0711]